jgi:hypothetical protein
MIWRTLVAATTALLCTLGNAAVPGSPAQQAYVKASNTSAADLFGWTVAIWGDTMVVGAANEDSNAMGVNGNQSDESSPSAGAAYVFVRNGGTWVQQAYLKASNTRLLTAFGSSVAISGDTIVVGAYAEDNDSRGVNGVQNNFGLSDSGAAYVFVRSGTVWKQQAYLKASNSDALDAFGWSVAISGDTIVVGAYNESSSATGVNGNQTNNNASASGAAYVFTRSGTNWTQQAYLKASNTDTNDNFGYSVAISGNTIVVGALYEDSAATGVNGNQSGNSGTNAGAAYVFVRSGTTWSQQAYLKASNTGVEDRFGISVGVSGDTAVVGAHREDSSATGVNGDQASNAALDSGAAYIFVRSGASWAQQAYLKPSNTRTNKTFGYASAISGDTVVISSPAEDSNATGVNGNQANHSASAAGAAYVFVRNGTSWLQQAYLKASNTESNEFFGQSVAISGDTVVAGAYWEDSAATGLNGNQADNSASQSGAAYVFTGMGIDRRMVITPDDDGGYFVRAQGIADVTYQLQRAPEISGPWLIQGVYKASSTGAIEFHDPVALPGKAFYRVVQQ